MHPIARLSLNSVRAAALATALTLIALLSLLAPLDAQAAFSNALSVTTSSSIAGEHPDLTLSTSLTPSPDLSALSIELPQGLRIGSGAVSQSCPTANALAGTCGSASRIGAASIARVGGADAAGEVYLTAPFASGDFAGLAVRVDLADGEKFIITGSLSLRSAGASQPEQKLVFSNVPSSGTNSTPVSLSRLTLAFDGQVGSPARGLVTNPSSCPATARAITSTATSTIATSIVSTQPYPVTGCGTIGFTPTFDQVFDSPTAGTESGASFQVDLPLGQGAVKTLMFKMPPFVGLNYPAYGDGADRCPATALSGPATAYVFNPASCPTQARIGTIAMSSPLLASPISGALYLVNRGLYPSIGISLSSGGAIFNFGGAESFPYVDVNCDPLDTGYCQSQLTFTVYNLPELPITNFRMEIGQPGRVSHSGTAMPRSLISMVDPNADECYTPQMAQALLVPWARTITTTLSDLSSIVGCAPGGTPASTILTAGPPSVTYASRPSFSFASTDSGDTFQCKVDGLAWAACTSPFVVASPLDDGAHRVKIRAINSFGPDPSPVVSAFTVDSQAPSAEIHGVENGQALGTDTPSIPFDVLLGDSAECRVDSSAWSPCVSPADLGPLADGDHRFEVRGKFGDQPGPADSVDFRIDTTAPQTNLVDGPLSGEQVKSPKWNFTSDESAATFKCEIDDGAFIACESPFEAVNLDDGSHTISIRATDAAGNVDPTPVEGNFVLDTEAPATPVITAKPNEVSGGSIAEFEFTGDGNSDFECKLDEAEYHSCDSPASYDELTDGTHEFSMRAADAAGNRSAPADFSWEIDFVNNQCRAGVTESEVLHIDGEDGQ